jgi:hypothetical protein
LADVTGGVAQLLVVRRHLRGMKVRTITFWTFIIGLLMVCYLNWALHRSSLNSFASGWPRPWPYPDRWLASWEHQMDLAHPSPLGLLKLDGEWQRQWIYLYCAIGVSLLVSLGSFIWWLILRNKKHDA